MDVSLDVDGRPVAHERTDEIRLDLAEGELEAADGRRVHAEPIREAPDEVMLRRAKAHQDAGRDLRGAATEPIQSSDPLLDPAHVPGRVVVNEGRRELEVPAFAAALVTQKQPSLRVGAEPIDVFLLLLSAHLRAEHRERLRLELLDKIRGKVIDEAGKSGEHDDLLVGPLQSLKLVGQERDPLESRGSATPDSRGLHGILDRSAGEILASGGEKPIPVGGPAAGPCEVAERERRGCCRRRICASRATVSSAVSGWASDCIRTRAVADHASSGSRPQRVRTILSMLAAASSSGWPGS